MSEIRIKNIEQSLVTQLKMAALIAGKTLRQFVIDHLTHAAKGSK